MEVSTSSSDSASLYHVSPGSENRSGCAQTFSHTCMLSFYFASLQVFERSSLLSRSKKKSKGMSVRLNKSRCGCRVRRVLTCLPVLSSCCRLQLEVPCRPSVRGGFPAGTWVRATVRAGCGRRRTPKPIFHRSGRSTGSSWKTRVCTGIWMRRWILNGF